MPGKKKDAARPATNGRASTNGKPAISNPPAVTNEITVSEAFSRVRNEAARLFAADRAGIDQRRQEFEQSYGSTTTVDSGLVNDMRALMIRCQALAQTNGKKKNSYSPTSTPNAALESVAKSLSAGIGAIEYYLAQNRALGLFAPTDQTAYLGAVSAHQVASNEYYLINPSLWVGPAAQGALALLDGLKIVPDPKPITGKGMKDSAPVPPPAACPHVVIDEAHFECLWDDNTPIGTCIACNETFVKVIVGTMRGWALLSIVEGLSDGEESEDSPEQVDTVTGTIFDEEVKKSIVLYHAEETQQTA